MSEEHLIGVLRKSGDVDALHDAAMEAMARLLERSMTWIPVEAKLPAQHQSVLIWLKGAEHATAATMNVDFKGSRYFLLANSGIWRREVDEVTHWMPLPAGPDGTTRKGGK